MNLRKHIQRLLDRDDVSQAIVLVVSSDMVAPGVPECGRRIEDHSDVYNIDEVSLGRLIVGLRSKADSLEMELKHLRVEELLKKRDDENA